MERRTMFKNIGMAGLATALPLTSSLAGGRVVHNDMLRVDKHPYHRFALGDLELTIVTDGKLTMQPVQPSFAPGVAADAVQALLRDNFRSTDKIELGMNILVIRKGRQVILVDAGAGTLFGPGSGWLPQSLVDAGFALNEVSDVVLTHAHPDHMGGLLRKDGSLVFPNAQVYLSQAEQDFWMAPLQDFSRSKYGDIKSLQPMIAGIKKNIQAQGKRLHFLDYSKSLLGCIRLHLAPGHTPGHTLVEIFSGSEKLLHIADLVHSDVLLFPHPEWGFYGDTDFKQAVTTRRTVLAALAASRTKVLAYHLPWPGLGHVRTKEEAFEWVADSFATPYAAIPHKGEPGMKHEC
ncbi:Glyoxylase, beta-lactamase superfamily II [Chitinophaga costaii]|uniref:Glyoxylase, beta-lactamase superfamily II n=1 Tax=Chitinophaga costaii TaxID=1335309 RepID=A0A1C4AS19_9BACT|nr:MBL fold metallo-hydrolase [Chitinophaga costaii]PUZ26725.1 MBL fold metallo-hydrolase [Chitinophaga costaii]SCB97452.1 Glyoxylase, beta-lactamase superfamily II [Chitinophaga costaii]